MGFGRRKETMKSTRKKEKKQKRKQKKKGIRGNVHPREREKKLR